MIFLLNGAFSLPLSVSVLAVVTNKVETAVSTLETTRRAGQVSLCLDARGCRHEEHGRARWDGAQSFMELAGRHRKVTLTIAWP